MAYLCVVCLRLVHRALSVPWKSAPRLSCVVAELKLPCQGKSPITDPQGKYFCSLLSTEGVKAKGYGQCLQQQEGSILHGDPRVDMGEPTDEREP